MRLRRSAYYRDQIAELVARDAPLVEFPVLTKSVLIAQFDRIVTDHRLTRALAERHLSGDRAGALLLDEYRVVATGGTTGERGIFVYDQGAWEVAVANLLRFQRWVGVFPDTRSLGIGASSPIHLTNRFAAELRVGRPGAPRLAVTTPVDEVVAALNAYQPEVLTTYPSFLRRLAEEQQSGRLHISPRRIRSVAETLSQDVRDLARAVWDVSLIGSYAATEVGVIGQECEHVSGLHLAEDLFVLEVVDEADHPVPAGVQGAKILVTTLTNRALPLVRYELSDIATLATGPCRCGSPFARIAAIEGRREEILRVPTMGGGQVEVHAGRLRSHLLRAAGIRQYQFAQLPGGLRIFISIQPGCDGKTIRRAVERSIHQALAALDAAAALVDVQIVDNIERAGTGAKEVGRGRAGAVIRAGHHRASFVARDRSAVRRLLLASHHQDPADDAQLVQSAGPQLHDGREDLLYLRVGLGTSGRGRTPVGASYDVRLNTVYPSKATA